VGIEIPKIIPGDGRLLLPSPVMKSERRNEMDCESEFLERIGSVQFSRVVMGKLRMDVDLLGAIQDLSVRERIHTGVILFGVGALKRAIFRNAIVIPPDHKVKEKDRIYMELEQPMELVSLPGWIATRESGETEVHAHFSASTVMDGKVVTLGGHLSPGTITSIKVMIAIGVIEDRQIKADYDGRLNQVDIFP
jgi:predicted DNA-binding protein with PD1-like motif